MGCLTHPIFTRIETISNQFVQYALISTALIFADALIIVMITKNVPRWLSAYSNAVHASLAIMIFLSFSWMMNPLFSDDKQKMNALLPISTITVEPTSVTSR